MPWSSQIMTKAGLQAICPFYILYSQTSRYIYLVLLTMQLKHAFKEGEYTLVIYLAE